MIQATITQRTTDWFEARVGHATASNFKHILAKLKSGQPAAARQNYLVDIVTERMTGQPASNFSNVAMQWGTDQEAFARDSYMDQFQVEVEETGFIKHDELMAGASPDGLVDWDGLIEIKAPYNSAVHIQTWLEGMPSEHMAQIQGQMWITGREWCDFVSFDPRQIPELQLYVQRIHRDNAFIADLEREVRIFLGDVDALVATLMAKTQQQQQRGAQA